jgi:uncharacterized membrane-anchored protein YjiN (DUF445 family)
MEQNNFESMGARLRNLLQKYANLIAITDELVKANKENDKEQITTLLNALSEYDNNNIQDIIDFSFTEPMEKINWRNTKLYMMQQLLEQQKK